MKKLMLFVFMCMFLISFTSAFDWDSGVEAYYTLNSTSSAIDSTGGTAGTSTGVSSITGILSTGYSFDGINDEVNFNNETMLAGDNTNSINLWVKDVTGASVIVGKRPGVYPLFALTIDASLYPTVNIATNAGTNFGHIGNIAIQNTDWSMVTMIQDGNN